MSAGQSNLDAWLSGRLRWLLSPAVVANSLTVGLLSPAAASLEQLRQGSEQILFLLAIGLAAVLQLALSGVALARVRTFRGLVSGRLPLSPQHRLAAIGELMRTPSSMAGLCVAGWLTGSVLMPLGMVGLAGTSWNAGFRLGLVGVLAGPLVTLLSVLVITGRAHEAVERLSEGLPPGAVIAAAPGAGWSIRSRTVAFTALLTLLPVVLLSMVAWDALGDAAGALAGLAPEARRLAADGLFRGWAVRLGGLGGFCVLFAVASAAAAGQRIATPLQRLASEARKIAGGHLEVPRVIAGVGEVWQVTGVFAQLQERLAGLVAKVLDAGAQVHTASDLLQRTSSRSQATTADQEAALNQTSSTTEELARSARQIAASAGSVLELARRTLEAAQQGQRDATDFQAAVDRMKQDNRSIAGAVERLRRRVLQIGRIVELINAVADRSDLLALSAELEGTRAGEVGRGFSLVGAEMRRLAENVLESTAEVEELIGEIRDATARTAEATERGSTLTQRGTALADEVTSSLAQVAALALETSNQARNITLSTQQQQSGTDQLAESMGDILKGTQEELATTQRLAEVNARLLGLSASLQGVVGLFTATKRERSP